MEIITIIIQAIATLITTLLANFFRSKVDKSFDKEEYCRNYLISQKNVNQQNNAINSGTISHSNVNVVQIKCLTCVIIAKSQIQVSVIC